MSTLYLKYEKTLYELSERQADEVRMQIQKGGRVAIGKELLFANRCEVVADLPYNREEYAIVPAQRDQLPAPDHTWRIRTPEEQERISKVMAEARAYLTEKLGWSSKK